MKPENADILIVDDLPDNLRLLSNVLKDHGYKVRPAPNGKLALKAAKNNPPDLIMLDINMPDMNGFEVCEELKKDPALTDVPVIFISALTESLDKVKAFNSGGVDYVTKPFDAKEVISRVQTHCQLRLIQKELEEKNEQLSTTLEELKLAQSQLVQSEKMASLGVLTAGIAHEINNPVNFINSGVKGLIHVQDALIKLMDLYDRSDCYSCSKEINELKSTIDYEDTRIALQELTDNILTGVKRTSEIVEGLRIFSHPDDQSQKLIDIHSNIDSAIMLLNNKLQKGGIAVIKEYGDVPMLYCYPGRMNQVFMNLLANAIDAVKNTDHPTSGEIKISTLVEFRNNRKGVIVNISDNGCGISEEIKEHIFEPFYTTKDVGNGVGLGLSITHGIIEDHNGSISLNDNLDGTSFQIWLPLQIDDE